MIPGLQGLHARLDCQCYQDQQLLHTLEDDRGYLQPKQPANNNLDLITYKLPNLHTKI